MALQVESKVAIDDLTVGVVRTAGSSGWREVRRVLLDGAHGRATQQELVTALLGESSMRRSGSGVSWVLNLADEVFQGL
jgi:hypothetical protein